MPMPTEIAHRAPFRRLSGLALSAVLLAGCVGGGGDAPSTATTADGGAGPVMTEGASTSSRLANLFAFNRAQAPAPVSNAPKNPIYCPKVTVQPGTAAMTLYERGKEGDPLSVRYQANFSEYARECVDLGFEAGLRVGVVGRAMIGPKGTPGQNMDVPIRFVVLDDKNNVLISRVTRLQVAIPAGQTSVTFTHVEELGSVPMPENRMRDWEFRIGFDSKPTGRPQS